MTTDRGEDARPRTVIPVFNEDAGAPILVSRVLEICRVPS